MESFLFPNLLGDREVMVTHTHTTKAIDRAPEIFKATQVSLSVGSPLMGVAAKMHGPN